MDHNLKELKKSMDKTIFKNVPFDRNRSINSVLLSHEKEKKWLRFRNSKTLKRWIIDSTGVLVCLSLLFFLLNGLINQSNTQLNTANQSNEIISKTKTKENNTIKVVKLDGKTVTSTTVSKVGKTMLEVNKPHISYNQANSIELKTFVDAIQRAERVKGVVDVNTPDYLLTLTFEDKTISKYSLWLGDDGGAIMNEKNTHTMYILPSDSIAELNKYVQEQTSTKKDVREVVWSQLSSQQKERVNGTWKDGKVSKVILTKDMMRQVKDKSYQGEEVILIDFPVKGKFKPNNMIVYADKHTFNYIGDGLVE